MFYQHTLNVSDPEKDFWPSPTEVWEALLLRVMQPDIFLQGLVGFQILSDDGETAVRQLDFGAAQVRDQVTRNAGAGWLKFDVARTESHAGGSLIIAMDIRQRNVALSFTYQTTMSDSDTADGVAPSEYVRAAYRASDADTVRVIRERIQGC